MSLSGVCVIDRTFSLGFYLLRSIKLCLKHTKYVSSFAYSTPGVDVALTYILYGISGFLDDKKSLEQKVQDELNEELGVGNDKIKLDWEARDYQWVSPDEANNLQLLPGFNLVLKKLSKLIGK